MTERGYRWVVWGFALLVVLAAALVGAALLPGNTGVSGPFQVSPGEISLCPGQGWQFQATAEGNALQGLSWEATGGQIGSEGFYVAPQTPGAYVISAYHPQTGYSASSTVHVMPCSAGAPQGSLPTPVTVAATEAPEPSPTALPSSSPTLRPTPTHTPSPTTPTPTAEPDTPIPTPALTPSPTPAASPTPVLAVDRRGDLVDYDTFAPIANAPTGADIRLACFDQDLQLIRSIPGELAAEIRDWNTAGYLILWMTLYEPVPEILEQDRYWLFALDSDGSLASGRPPGDGPVIPDLGPEVSIGVRSMPAAGITFEVYLYVWNTAIQDSEVHSAQAEARLGTTREAIFIRVPYDVLESLIRELSQTEPRWERATGRAATIVSTGTGRAIDFFPELPGE